MRTSSRFRAVGIVAVLVLTAVPAACSSEDPAVSAEAGTPAQQGAPAQQDGEAGAREAVGEALEGPDGADGRAFDVDRDQAREVIETTFASQDAKATWDGTTLRVELDGEAGTPVAHLPCRAVEAVLEEGEEAVLVYPDGELRCADE